MFSDTIKYKTNTMIKINTSTRLTIKLLTTKKNFICYDLDTTKTRIVNFVLTDDLYRYRNKFDSFKTISCIKKQFNQIEF